MRITLEPHGRTFDAAADESILDAAFRARVTLPHGCRGGSCGSCRARLVSGAIDYPRGTPLGLAPAEAAAGIVLLCRAHARTDATVEAREVRRASDVEVKTLPCRVASIEAPSPGVRRLRLRLPAIESFEFRPGQYVDLLLPDGVRRSYSIASPPHDAATLELHVARKPGGRFSTLAFESLRAGALLRIEGPLGAFAYEALPDEFPLDAGAGGAAAPSGEVAHVELPPALFVAGGTGFAPLKSMLRHALEGGSRRVLHVYWGARAAEELYDHAWLQERSRHFPRLRYVAVSPDVGDGNPVHRRGLVHEAVAHDVSAGVLGEMDTYAAGPPAMLDALRGVLDRAGWSGARVRTDAFD